MNVAYYPRARDVRQVALAALFALSMTSQASTSQKSAVDVSNAQQILELGKTVRGELRGSQGHEYRFDLPASEYAHLEINQKSIDLGIEVFGPDGKQMFEANVTTAGELEVASLISSAAG